MNVINVYTFIPVMSIIRRFLILIFIMGICWGYPVPVSAENFFEGKVERVVNGDTIILRGGTIVKYMGIEVPDYRDANPLFRDIGMLAYQYNKQMVDQKTVRLELVQPSEQEPEDSRKYAYVFVGGRMVNALLLKKGYAAISRASPPDPKYLEFFVNSQNQALFLKAGIWQKFTTSSKQAQGAFK